MDNQGFIACAKRMSAVLLGKTDPSVIAVNQSAHALITGLSALGATPTIDPALLRPIEPERIKAVLLGRPEPSVERVAEASTKFIEGAHQLIGEPLRRVYQDTVEEGIPARFAGLLGRLSNEGQVRAAR